MPSWRVLTSQKRCLCSCILLNRWANGLHIVAQSPIHLLFIWVTGEPIYSIDAQTFCLVTTSSSFEETVKHFPIQSRNIISPAWVMSWVCLGSPTSWTCPTWPTIQMPEHNSLCYLGETYIKCKTNRAQPINWLMFYISNMSSTANLQSALWWTWDGWRVFLPSFLYF